MLRSQLLSPPVCVHLENELLTPASSVPDFVHSICQVSIFVLLFSTEMLSRADRLVLATTLMQVMNH